MAQDSNFRSSAIMSSCWINLLSPLKNALEGSYSGAFISLVDVLVAVHEEEVDPMLRIEAKVDRLLTVLRLTSFPKSKDFSRRVV
jgi:hypothetical protein